MDAATAGLLGVIAGGIFGLLGGLAAALIKSHSDEAAWQRRRSDEHNKAHRAAIFDFVRKATKATQRMHWLNWEAHNRSKPEAAFDVYNKEMRDLLADIFAAAAVLDMLIFENEDPTVETPVVKMVHRITAADALIGDAERLFRSGAEWTNRLNLGMEDALKIHDDLLSRYPWEARAAR